MGLPKGILDQLLPQFFLRRQVLCMSDIVGDIQEQITQAILGLNLLSKDPIKLIIDSVGGTVLQGRWIADAVRCSEAPVHGLVVGAAYSMAFWVLQNCQRRMCYPHARFMFHGYDMKSYRCDEPKFLEQAQKNMQSHREDLDFVIRRTHQSLDKWQEWSRNERYFSANEALELGIIDEIIKPEPISGLDEIHQVSS